MRQSVFDYENYKTLIVDALHQRFQGRRGARSKLARTIGCHTAYVSQVLNGSSHFSLEQSERAASLLGFNLAETRYLLALNQYERAGTPELKKICAEQINELIDKQFQFKGRLQYKKALTAEDRAQFYSSWIYGAIHVLVSVPGCSSAKGISDYLGLPPAQVMEALDFLTTTGLVKKKGTMYEIGVTHIHLDGESPLIAHHHKNWRLKVSQMLDCQNPSDLHYSSVITASKADSVRIKRILAKAIDDVRKVVRSSDNEACYSYLIDFFSLER